MPPKQWFGQLNSIDFGIGLNLTLALSLVRRGNNFSSIAKSSLSLYQLFQPPTDLPLLAKERAGVRFLAYATINHLSELSGLLS
jgi:hypothetical protein